MSRIDEIKKRRDEAARVITERGWTHANSPSWTDIDYLFSCIEAVGGVVNLDRLEDIVTAGGERCAECGHQGWLVNGVCQWKPGLETTFEEICGCKCVFPTPPEGPKSNLERHAYQEHPLYPNYCAFAVGDEDYCKRGPDNEIHLSDDVDQHGRRVPFDPPTPLPAEAAAHEHRWVGRGYYGDTSSGHMCADCGVDLDDTPGEPSTANTSAAVESAREAAREIFRYLETTRPHPTSPEWNSVNVTATGKTILEDAVTAIISKHFPPTEAAVPAGDKD